MDGGGRERVEALRREIAEIQKLNLEYFQKPRLYTTATGEYERRELRLSVAEKASSSNRGKPICLPPCCSRLT
jgi:hypothetical protein